jgi:hypothetical protein
MDDIPCVICVDMFITYYNRSTRVVWFGLDGATGCAASPAAESGASASGRMGGGDEATSEGGDGDEAKLTRFKKSADIKREPPWTANR